MREDDFKALEARWRELYDQYESVKSMLSPIVRWEWTKTKRYDSRPFYFELNPSRGSIMKSPPANDQQKIHHHEYGFDAQGRTTIEHYYTHYGVWETLYRYMPDKVEVMMFTKYQNRLLLSTIAQGAMSSGRMQRYASLKINYNYIDPTNPFLAPGQRERYTGEGLENATADDIWTRLSSQKHGLEWGHTEYTYDGKSLVLMKGARFTSGDKAPFETENHFEYNAEGQLQRIIWIRLDGVPGRVVYQRLKSGETLASLTERAVHKLVEAIPQTIAAAHFTEPLYCLNLYYFLAKVGDYFPPQILPGFERDRQRKLQAYTSDKAESHIWWYLWDGREPEHVPHEPLRITDKETLDACEQLEVEANMRPQSWFPVKVLYQIARELNQLDWSQYTPVTPDFIVYACDQTEHVDITTSLRRSGATQAQIKDWRKRGILY